MIIGIDVRCLEEERISGVGEYCLELLKNIFAIDKENEYVLLTNSFRAKNQYLSQFNKYQNVRIRRFHFPNQLINFLIWYLKWPKADKLVGGADAFFAPNISFIAVSKSCPLVLTIHDLSFERYPDFVLAEKDLAYIHQSARIGEKAAKLIAISRSTQRDLEKLYGCYAHRIKTIPNGISDIYRPTKITDEKLQRIKLKYKLPEKFILCLGALEPRKNIVSVIRAFSALKQHSQLFSDFKLVICGSKGWLYQELLAETRKMEENGEIIYTGYVDSEEKAGIYSLASIFVYPSYFEGFGLPPLEAMACGTPVIAANTSSLPETVGKAALLIDPDRPDEIQQALEAIIKDNILRFQLIADGFEQAKKFSWKNSALDTISVFEELHKTKRDKTKN